MHPPLVSLGAGTQEKQGGLTELRKRMRMIPRFHHGTLARLTALQLEFRVKESVRSAFTEEVMSGTIDHEGLQPRYPCSEDMQHEPPHRARLLRHLHLVHRAWPEGNLVGDVLEDGEEAGDLGPRAEGAPEEGEARLGDVDVLEGVEETQGGGVERGVGSEVGEEVGGGEGVVEVESGEGVPRISDSQQGRVKGMGTHICWKASITINGS